MNYLLTRHVDVDDGDEYIWYLVSESKVIVAADVSTIEAIAFYPGVEEMLEALRRAGWKIIEPACPIPSHPCGQCDGPVRVNDYLCPACRQV